jgi:transcriptional regulator with XRE-family HTH domain
METVGKRLKIIRRKLNLSQEKFATSAGVLQKDVSLLESGRKKFIPNEYILYLSNQGVDLNWLFTGVGEMFRQDTLRKYAAETAVPTEPGRVIPLNARQSEGIVTMDVNNRSAIAMVPIKASARYTAYCNDREYIGGLEAFSLPEFKVGNFRAFEIMGDSMELTISSQDWVVGERITSPSQLKDGAIYVIVTAGNIVCKRIRNQIERRGVIVLQSDNPEYEDQPLEPIDIIELWLVRARITRDFRSTYASVKYYTEEISRLEKVNTGLLEMHKKG